MPKKLKLCEICGLKMLPTKRRFHKKCETDHDFFARQQFLTDIQWEIFKCLENMEDKKNE